ncbi:MAG TPA: hypothetical protein VIF37_03950 [Methylobacter sp.]|jgi:hypothetical protein
MNQSIISALAAVLGSLVGGASTIATAWFTQRAQSRQESVNAEIRRRELVYTEFINECSKLAIEAFNHTLENPGTLMNAYALLNRIRLISSDPVVDAADQMIKGIVEQYFQPNLPMEELQKMTAAGRADPLKEFSVICREELRRLSRES